MQTFDDVWFTLQKNLTTCTGIKNWTAFRGYLGDLITIAGIRENHIEVDAPNASTIQVIPKGDFEKVWQVWIDYKIQKVKRFELMDKSIKHRTNSGIAIASQKSIIENT